MKDHLSSPTVWSISLKVPNTGQHIPIEWQIFTTPLILPRYVQLISIKKDIEYILKASLWQI